MIRLHHQSLSLCEASFNHSAVKSPFSLFFLALWDRQQDGQYFVETLSGQHPIECSFQTNGSTDDRALPSSPSVHPAHQGQGNQLVTPDPKAQTMLSPRLNHKRSTREFRSNCPFLSFQTRTLGWPRSTCLTPSLERRATSHRPLCLSPYFSPSCCL